MLPQLARWWNEFHQPTRKCLRIGHNFQIEQRTGYIKDPENYFVAIKVVQERYNCTRCDAATGVWDTIVKLGSFTSLTWATSQMEEFDKDGEYWIDRKWISR